jgi:predicted aspartyl protease
MIGGMLCRTKRVFAARCFIICVAGFPSATPVLEAQSATAMPLADQFTPEYRSRPAHAIGAQTSPLKFELRERYQIVARGDVGRLEGLNLLIDTGSIPSMVDRRVARKLDMDTQPSEIVSFGQKSRVQRTVLPSIRLGPLHADAITAYVGDLAFLHGVDAVIGLDVLSRSSFSIDYETREVTFGPLAIHESTVPLEFTPPFLTVQLMLTGRPVRLLVDTGSRRLVLFERRTGNRIPRLPSQGEHLIHHISGASHLRRVFLPPVDAGGTTIEHLEGYMSDAAVDGYPPDIDGVLGIRALASKRVEFDFERNRLSFR